MKDETKGAEVRNYRPIACLPTTFKLLTGIIAEHIYGHLNRNGLLLDEQKGCRRKTRGTKDQLLTNKMVLKNCRRKHTNLNMAWIDYNKAYDMVSHSWILESVTSVGIAENIKGLLKNSMGNRKTLNAYGTTLGEVNIWRRIFQGDSLSPLLFVIAIIPLTRMLRQCDIGYQLVTF